MPDFLWKAARANSDIVEGRSQAASQAQAMQQLRAQGLTPLQISEAGVNVSSVARSADSAASPWWHSRRAF